MTYFIAWFGLLWVGWTLVFASGEVSVVQSTTGQPAEASDLLYFVGFTVITLGTGDYVPNGAVWQTLTVAASASGFFLVTMLITYVLPVLSAVVEKRQLPAQVHGLGDTPAAMLERARSGAGYTALDAHLTSLVQQIHRIEKQHLAYPVLHHFHTTHRRSALPAAVASLDDFLSVLLFRVPAEQRPPDAVLGPLRDAITGLLSTLDTAFIEPSDRTPPAPTLPKRLSGGQDGGTGWASGQQADRRRLLLGWLQDDGWEWPPPN